MTQQDNSTIENAGAIIERFGGIRPMASKISVPVTTVQGWKKRDAIPAGRLEQIRLAAREHNVEIADILKIAPIANENRVNENRVAPQPDIPPAPVHMTRDMGQARAFAEIAPKTPLAEKNALVKSSIINAFLVLAATGAVVLLLWPQSEQKLNQNGRRIAALERNVTQLEGTVSAYQKAQSAYQQAQSTAQNIVPAIQTQAQIAAQQAVSEAKIIAHDALAPDAGSINQRILRTEAHVNEIAAAITPAALMSRVQALEGSVTGQHQLESAWASVAALVTQAPADGVDNALISAAQENPALQQTFAGLQPQDIKPAAAMLGAAQLDAALGRDNAPFNANLDALKVLIPNDPALAAGLDKIAPFAATGVLTPATLTANFAKTGQDAVQASLEDPNATLADRAKAQLNNVLQVEKDGALVTGTPTQGAVTKAQQSLAANDIGAAIDSLSTLGGPAGAAVAPWLAQAQATLAAQQVRERLNSTFGFRAAVPQISVGDGSPGH